MDSETFFARINAIREQLDLPGLEPTTPTNQQNQDFETYLVQRTSSDKETNTYLNHTFTAAGEAPLTVETLQDDLPHRRDQLRIEGLEAQLREWMSYSKQKEEEIAQRYEETITGLKKHYDEVATLYERRTAEQLKFVKEEHEKEVEELKKNLDEAKSALKEYKKALTDRENALDQTATDSAKLKGTIEELKGTVAGLRTELKVSQETLRQTQTLAEGLQGDLSEARMQVEEKETIAAAFGRDLSQAKETENVLNGAMEALQGELKSKIQLIEELKTELVEQTKEVQKLVQASKELTEQRTSEREFIRKYREEIEGLENLKWQLEKETAELAAQKQQSLNEYVEEYEERYQKAVNVAEMWKSRADFTLAKFYTFARSLRLEVITLKNEIVDWQETALTEFTKTVAQITRKYKFMLEDSQDYSLRMSEKCKKLKKGKKTGLY